ncbi:MAG: hypothetical protein PVG35_23485 [Desulfobacterales bacterium]|jgi:hypothetical protein
MKSKLLNRLIVYVKEIHPVVLNSASEELMRQIFKKGYGILIRDPLFISIDGQIEPHARSLRSLEPAATSGFLAKGTAISVVAKNILKSKRFFDNN